MQHDDVITNPKWLTDTILRIFITRYLRVLLSYWCEIWRVAAESHVHECYVTKVTNFRNFRWRTKMVISVANHPIWVKFGVRMHNGLPRRVTWRKVKIFCEFKMRPTVIHFWLHLSLAVYCQINAKFDTQKNYYARTQVLWPEYQSSKIQDGGSPISRKMSRPWNRELN